MKIEIVLSCLKFQCRLCWMLSSLMQQTTKNFSVTIVTIPNDGEPSTEEVVKCFSNIDIKILYVNEKYASKRGIHRDLALRKSLSQWLLFTDSDVVFSPTFIEECNKYCIEKNSAFLFHCIRNSTYIEETDEIISSFIYPCVVSDVYDVVKTLKNKKMSCRCAGYCHLVNREFLNSRMGGVYFGNKRRDNFWAFSSDVKFKKRFLSVGGKIVIMQNLFLYHLNHLRNSAFVGKVMIQR